MYNKDTTAIQIPYPDENCQNPLTRFRVGISTSERYRWKRFKRGQRQRPLGLQFLHKAKEANYIILEEGETGFATLLHNDIPALGLPGAGSWNDDWIGHFDGIDEVFVWEEPDDAGKRFVEKIRAAMPNVLVVEAPVGFKDPNEMAQQSGSGFKQWMEELSQEAREAGPEIQESQAQTLTWHLSRGNANLVRTQVMDGYRRLGTWKDSRPFAPSC